MGRGESTRRRRAGRVRPTLIGMVGMGLLAGCLAAGAQEAPAVADGSPLSLADLESYREALADPPTEPAPAVTFRELWDRPEAFRGRRVTVEGRLVRRFRQDAIGQFPPLVEEWLATPSGDLLCIVHPEAAGSIVLRIGSTVRFSGRYLRRLRYGGGDVDRLAPLVVGGGSPELVKGEAVGPGLPGLDRFGPIDWAIGLAAGGLIVVALLSRALRKPVSRGIEVLERLPPPEFLDPEADPYNEAADTGRPAGPSSEPLECRP